MELKSYQNNSYMTEDLSLDMSPNKKLKLKNSVSFSDAVIEFSDVSLTFGKNKVLETVNMIIPYGKIYSIIGPKQSGKTLILQSIIGLIKPSKGEIRVFNKKPEYSSAIGYMPQEMSLFDDLTIEETMKYFGQLYDLPIDLINNKIDHLVESLSVNNKNILIKLLRNNDRVIVSLAVAVLHSPQLLILDEPTIYCDPMLNNSVWKQLRSLCTNQNVTIIISTSHIEEAQHSDIVAFIRDGSLIAEEVPKSSVIESKRNSIEDIFINLFENNKLIENNEKEKFQMCRHLNINNNNNNNSPNDNNSFSDINLSPNLEKVTTIKTSSINRISTLYYRNLKSKLRNPYFLIFELLFPAIAISMFTACIGHNPYDIPVGVYNPDRPAFASHLVLKGFNEKVISLRYYSTFESGINAIREHEVWALLTFPHNYTRSLIERSSQGCETAEELLDYDIEEPLSDESVIHSQSYPFMKDNNNTVESVNQTNGRIIEDMIHIPKNDYMRNHNQTHKSLNKTETEENSPKKEEEEEEEEYSDEDKPHDSEDDREINEYEGEHEITKPKLLTTIDLYMDNTNLLISGAIKAQVLKALKNARNRSIELAFGSSHAPPIQLMEPMIFGSDEVEMSEFITPGVIISIVFLSSILFPGLTIIKERKDRHYERSTIAGVKAHEFIISHLIIHIIILIIQITLILICIFTIFDFPLIGSIYLVFSLIFIQGLNGLIYSIAISSFCCHEIHAIIVWLTTFSVVVILSGTFWPVECMPKFALFISHFLPQSIAGNGLRSILSRGWGLSQITIQMSLLLPIVWIVTLFSISILMFRMRK